jgi:hypothetical protein
MLAQQVTRSGTITPGDSLYHRFVLGVGDREAAAVLEPAKAEKQQPLRQQSVAFGQARIPGEVDQHVVKLQIQRVVTLDILPAGRVIHLFEDLLEVAKLLRRGAFRDAFTDQLVERFADVVDLICLYDRYFPDKNAAIFFRAYETGFLETA